MNESINNSASKKQEILKEIIKDLHSGVSVEKLQKTFANLIKDTSPEEIAEMENALIQEGFPPSEIQRLCDVHAQVFEKSLAKVGKPSKIPGHPIYTFIQENKEVKKILKELSKKAKKIKKGEPKDKELEKFESDFKRLKEIEKHYLRKENLLFPKLEEKKFTGPTQVMWGKHDEIREHLKKTESLFQDKNWNEFYKQYKTLSSEIQKMIFLEEKILYPTSSKKLSDTEWEAIKKDEAEVGYAWVVPSNLWDANLAKAKSNQATELKENLAEVKSDGRIQLSQGQLTNEQIDLLLKNLPVDITFVDENDKVCYYSDNTDRVFVRTPAIIGRAVQNCHPPDSINIVNDIIKNFKEKKKNVAEFWIQMSGKFLHIRYFPIYDNDGNYKGVIEVTQDVTNIRKLEGERRLLDW